MTGETFEERSARWRTEDAEFDRQEARLGRLQRVILLIWLTYLAQLVLAAS